jgi:nicotinamide-nucleotide amidase
MEISMNVELISVGTEILLGNIVNTNAAYLAEKCAVLGLSCFYQSVVGDNEKRLCEALETALGRSDVVILSGGLGPTQDDLTKECVAKVLHRELVMDEQSRERIENYFSSRGWTPTDNNWKQAYAPQGAIVLDNENGTAPGLIVEEGEKRVVLLPGPPNELKPLFEQQVIPYLDSLESGTIYSKTVKICGIGESKVETQILDLINEQGNPTIAPYAKTGEVHLRVTAKAEEEKEARKLVKPVVKELKSRFGNAVYSTEEEVTLERSIVDLLLANGLTVSTVESCTGGLVAGRLTKVPGVSQVFKNGLVTYSNKAKRKLVGVKRMTLDKYGAVSSQVAKEMARGLAAISKADVTVAVTGLAGPDGGTEEKPIGLVYVGCCVCGTTTVKEYHFSGDRDKIRESATAYALILMRQCILEYYSQITFGKEKK